STFVRSNLCAFGCHEIDGLYSTERYGVVVGTLVAHDTDGAHVGEGCKVLIDLFVKAGFGDLLAVDGVSILHDADFLGGDFADDADAKARAREWLAEYQVFRDAQFKAGFADLVFEEVAERLNDFFEVDVVREAAHIVVGFDDGGFAAEAALYYVRVDGSLCQIVDGSDFLCFFLKDTDEFFADDL